jgi:hypothetical protein
MDTGFLAAFAHPANLTVLTHRPVERAVAISAPITCVETVWNLAGCAVPIVITQAERRSTVAFTMTRASNVCNGRGTTWDVAQLTCKTAQQVAHAFPGDSISNAIARALALAALTSIAACAIAHIVRCNNRIVIGIAIHAFNHITVHARRVAIQPHPAR